MAKVKVEGAKVTRIIEGHGFVATTQSKTRAGKDITEYWTVWADSDVTVGEVLDITGDISVRLEEYTDKNTGQSKQGAGAHINNVMLKRDTPF